MTASTRKLLCIALDGSEAPALPASLLPGWDVCAVRSLREAERAIRGCRIGLLAAGTRLLDHAPLDRFLSERWHMLWIALLAPCSLKQDAWRDLVRDHIHDFHTGPVD